jgi:hypothetical protein
MLTLEWNALRVGDRVVVHDPTGGDILVQGSVAMVDMRRGSNGVGIRIARAGASRRIIWPGRLAVHRDHGSEETCWRCHALREAVAA